MTDIIDSILKIKSRCRLAEEIGEAYKLNERELLCLFAVERSGTTTSKDLSKTIDLSSSRGSRIVNRLVDRGLISALPDSIDRRRIRLSLTAGGERCVADIDARKVECEKKLVADLSEQERAVVAKGIELLAKVM